MPTPFAAFEHASAQGQLLVVSFLRPESHSALVMAQRGRPCECCARVKCSVFLHSVFSTDHTTFSVKALDSLKSLESLKPIGPLTHQNLAGTVLNAEPGTRKRPRSASCLKRCDAHRRWSAGTGGVRLRLEWGRGSRTEIHSTTADPLGRLPRLPTFEPAPLPEIFDFWILKLRAPCESGHSSRVRQVSKIKACRV